MLHFPIPVFKGASGQNGRPGAPGQQGDAVSKFHTSLSFPYHIHSNYHH